MKWLPHLPFLLVVGLFGHGLCMFQKRGREEGPDEGDPHKKLRNNVADLFLANEIAGARAGSVFQDAAACGLRGFRKLAEGAKSKKNVHRNILRTLGKNSKWPELYWAKIRVWKPKQQVESWSWVPFLLPHELVAALSSSAASPDQLFSREGLSQHGRRHIDMAEQQLGDSRLVPIGLWGDGVPCNYDRSESLECFTVHLPGQTGKYRDLRIPCCVLNKKFVLKDETFDDIMSVLTWSFEQLALGTMPVKKHDGSPFAKQDKKRKKAAGQSIPRGILVELAGDWAFYKSLLRLPQHNEKDGCCWLCAATPDNYKDCSMTAPWRQQRLSHWDLMRRMQEKGVGLSPLWSVPFFTSSCVQIDWLHTADKGVTADFLGSYFKYLLRFFPGTTIKQRCSNLFLDIQRYYQANAVETQLQNLVPTMLGKKQQKPKFNGKAAEARFLMPYVVETCARFLGQSELEVTVAAAAEALNNCYKNLSAAVFDADDLGQNCRRYCLLAVALERQGTGLMWGVRPKLHLFQEMCEFSRSCPALSWTYRDEDFGGSLARGSVRRGGASNPSATGRAVLQKFCAKHALPRL